jgi:hypothetical protein
MRLEVLMGNKISEKFVLTNEGIIKIKTPKRRLRANVYNVANELIKYKDKAKEVLKSVV